MITIQNLEIIKSLVSNHITEEHLKFIDSFVSPKLSIFMPIGGSCGYAVTHNHRHPAYMFVLPYDHETEIVVEGRRFNPYPNSIFCLSPEVQHHEVQNYLPPKYCAIFIETELFERNYKIYKQKLPKFNGVIIDIKKNKLNLLVQDFINESQNAHASKDIVLYNIATLITHEIIRNILDCHSYNNILTDNILINEAVKYINTDFEKDICIEDLAVLSSLSKSHFTKVFTEEMGQSPMVYIRIIRLQNAKKMLRAKELSVTQVARQCGFNSTSYFTKLFKEFFNETPKEFMQRIK